MRIVDVNEYYSPTGGGVRTYLDRKMAILGELGHELIVIAPARANRVEERPGGRIHWVRTPGMPFDGNYGLFWEAAPVTGLLDAIDPDVVEASSPWRPAWIVGTWPGRAVKVFFAHNDNLAAYAGRWLERVAEPERIERWFAWYTRYMARFLTCFDAFVTNGPALAGRYARRGLRVDAVMPLGIARGDFSPGLRDEGLRASLLADCGLGADAGLLLGVGRLHPEKRWPMIVDAVAAAGRAMPVGLVLLGDGMARAALARRVAGVPAIRLLRPVYDRPRFARIMASADALIHGSHVEPFGLVALEAVASGLPLIVPDEGGAFEIARGAFAECYRARDAAACTAAIGRLFAREPTVRAAAVEASATVRTDRDHAIALVDYYSALIAARRRGA